MIKLVDILNEIKINKPFRYEKAYGESHSYNEYNKNIKNFNKLGENQQIQNINYYQQILDQSNGLSITQRQYLQKIIDSVKKQNNKATPKQYELLQRIKSGNFKYSTKNEIKINAPKKNIYIKSKEDYNYIDKDTLEGYLEHVIDEDYLDELRKYMQFEDGFGVSEDQFFSDNTIPVIKGKSVEQITNKDVETFFKGEVSWYIFGNGYSFPYRNQFVQEIKVINPNLIKTTWVEEDEEDINFGFNLEGKSYYAHIYKQEPDEVTIFISDSYDGIKNKVKILISYLNKKHISYKRDDEEEGDYIGYYITIDRKYFNI